MTRRVAVLDTGVANLASVLGALRPLAEVVIAREPGDAADATHLVVPGVGAFGPAVARLRESGLARVVADAHAGGTPILAICLGFQMLCDGSEEAPDVRGLSLVAGHCRLLNGGERLPHLGWNWVDAGGLRGVASGYAAFAHSYCLPDAPAGARAAWCHYGTSWVAALEYRGITGCQFHPELSGAWGRGLLRRWVEGEAAIPDRSAGRGNTVRRLVPCLDVRHGRTVKGVRFRALRDTGDPALQAARYEHQGADEIVVLDIAAAPENRNHASDTIRRVRSAVALPLIAGGGVRSLDDARALLEAGADRISVNTAALDHPELIDQCAREFGQQCVVLAVDARRTAAGWEALASGGRRIARGDAIAWCAEGARRGAGELLVTSWDRDGTRAGCDLELVRAAAASASVPVIASGGVGAVADVDDAFRAGASAVLAASVFHDGDMSVADLKLELASRGWSVRP